MTQIKNQLQSKAFPIGLIQWNKDFKFQSWSPEAEKIFGFTANEVLGKHPYDFLIPEDVRHHVDMVWSRLFKGDASAHSINECVTKDGRTIICSWTNTLLKQRDGSITGVQSIVQDITEHRKNDLILNRLDDTLNVSDRGNTPGQFSLVLRGY